MACPKECEEDRERMKDDIKRIFGALIALLTIYGGLWFYVTSFYATKTELKEVKQEVKDVRQEINLGFKEVLRKLDK